MKILLALLALVVLALSSCCQINSKAINDAFSEEATLMVQFQVLFNASVDADVTASKYSKSEGDARKAAKAAAIKGHLDNVQALQNATK